MKVRAAWLATSILVCPACSPSPGPDTAPSPSAGPTATAASTAEPAASAAARTGPLTPCEKAWKEVPDAGAAHWTFHDVKPDVASAWVGYWTVGVLEACDYFVAVRMEKGKLGVYASSCGGLPVAPSLVTVETDSLSVDGNWASSDARTVWGLFQDVPERATGKVLRYAPGLGPSATPPEETLVTFMRRCPVP